MTGCGLGTGNQIFVGQIGEIREKGLANDFRHHSVQTGQEFDVGIISYLDVVYSHGFIFYLLGVVLRQGV